MRFFRSFSLLHRRTKSESAAAKPVASKVHLQTRSLSVHQFDEQVLIQDNDIFRAVVPSNTPTFSDPVPCTTCPSITPISAPVALAVADERILALETETTLLKEDILALTSANEELRNDLMNAQGDLFAELHKDLHHRRQAKADEEEIKRLEDKLAQYDKFLSLMINIGLHEPVLNNARGALRAGEDADEALVDAIKEAAAKPGSAWASIMPAITGSRTSDQYLSAINMTLKVRRELKEAKKVIKFWKRAAQEDDRHEYTITPSASNISSIHEMLSEKRQTAVDDLLAKLRTGTYRVRRRVEVPEPESIAPTLAPATISLDETTASPMEREPIDTPEILEVSDTRPSILVTASNSISTVRDSASTTRGPYVPNLPPLASESFKEELVASQSHKRFSKKNSSSKLQSRAVLGEVDLNRDTSNSTTTGIPESDSTMTQGSKRSAKALGKRRAMLVSQSIESIEVRTLHFFRAYRVELQFNVGCIPSYYE